MLGANSFRIEKGGSEEKSIIIDVMKLTCRR